MNVQSSLFKEVAIDTIKKIFQNLLQEDHWYEKLPCDILLIDSQNPNIVIGHRMADCPIVIAEDTKKQVAAVSHCGAKQINREVPRWTVEALKKEVNSNPEDIHIYIGSCIKKENYQYDKYPAWATNQEVWKECITKKGDIYYANLDPIIGSEQNGTRPVVVVQNNLGNKYSPTVLIAPLTSKSKKKNYLPTHIEIKSNEKITHDSLILLEQVRVLDKTRLISFLCSLNEEEINLVNKSLKDTFDIK